MLFETLPTYGEPAPEESNHNVIVALAVVIAVLFAFNMAMFFMFYKLYKKESKNQNGHVELADMSSARL